jgi:hypothetical protein
MCVHQALAGKTFVLTGLFPEAGGGSGLSLGKPKVKKLIQSFGGRVTGSVSGRTDFLVTGKQPGFSKVSKARGSARCQLIDLKTLNENLKTTTPRLGVDDVQAPILIQEFSAGYALKSGPNGLALTASRGQLAVAMGVAPAQIAAPRTEKKKKAKAAPKKKQTAPKKEQTAPKKKQTAPKKKQTAPKKKQTAPRKKKASVPRKRKQPSVPTAATQTKEEPKKKAKKASSSSTAVVVVVNAFRRVTRAMRRAMDLD